MDFGEYQLQAHRTNKYPAHSMIDCLVLGLCSEAGEVADKMKKFYRDGNTHLDADMRKELGDCLWYASEIATYFNLLLSDIAENNIAKLRDRVERGMINGSGDDR